MSYVVVAKWTARAGEEAAVAEAVGRLADATRTEPGNVTYRVSRDLEDPAVFLIYEEYVDEAASLTHRESAHFARYATGAAFPRLQARERQVYETLAEAAGDGARRHAGVVMTGPEGEDGPKAFSIDIEARPGQGDAVLQMLRDILACVETEPETGPWYGVRHSDTRFAIFETFPSNAGRQAHVEGGGGEIFRDIERMNAILARPAHVQKVDVLLSKQVFTF